MKFEDLVISGKRGKAPLCIHCKVRKVNRPRALFCSSKCYSESGHRANVGKINGAKWSVNYWKRFYITFNNKFGHLDWPSKCKVLVGIGVRRGMKLRRKNAIKTLSRTSQTNE